MYYQTPNENLRFLASMHLVPAASPKLPQWALDAYCWSDCLVFEAELSPASLLHFMADDGISLSEKLSPGVYAGLKQLWSTNVNLPSLDHMRPWAAAMLSGTLLSNMVPGIESNFVSSAIKDGKSLEYLESPSAFPAFADKISLQAIDSTVAKMLAKIATWRANQLAMHQAWLSADTLAFGQVAQTLPLLQVSEIKRAILDLRNEAWATRLKALAACNKRTLVAVGALHLFVSPTAQHFSGVELKLIN